MPSTGQAFSDLGELADDRRQNEVLAKGVPAKAFVRGFPEQVPGDRFAMHIRLEVHPPSGGPYEVDYVFPSARMLAPLVAGMEVPIRIMPDDPQRIAVQWDVQKGAIAAQGGDMAAVENAMGNAYASAADTAMRQAMAKQKAEDPTERLKKLGQVHAAGLITDDEFAAKKQAILDEL